MSKVHYYDHLNQGEGSVLGRDYHVRTPLDEVMDLEEGREPEVSKRISGAWVLEILLEMVFVDEVPMDWRYAGKRGLGLLRSFSPGLLAGRPLDEAVVLAGLASRGRYAQDALERAAEGQDEELRVMLDKLLHWVYQVDGKRWLEKGTWRLYVLASRYHGRALKVWEDEKVVNGAERAGRFRDMGYADFAVAFNEEGVEQARARWSYRAQQILEGIPQVPGTKSDEARERMRLAALGNGNRRGKVKGKS